MRTTVFTLKTIPDRRHAGHRVQYLGDPFRAACDTLASFRKTLASQASGTAHFGLVFARAPSSDNDSGSEEKYLQTSIVVGYSNTTQGGVLQGMLRSGPLENLYRTTKGDPAPCVHSDCKLAFSLVRNEQCIAPSVELEFNPWIQSYYLPSTFSPESDHDYMIMGDIFATAKGPLVIEVAAAPDDVAPERKAHAQYLRLQREAVRSWRTNDDRAEFTALEPDDSSHTGRHLSADLEFHRDPIGENSLRDQERFHESFDQPHFRFAIRAYAAEASDGLMALNMFAGSVFADDSYAIVEDVYNGLVCLRSSSEWPSPHCGLDIERPAGLDRLASICSSDEMDSLIRFPMADGPHHPLFRTDTDPPRVIGQREIWLGRWEDVRGDLA